MPSPLTGTPIGNILYTLGIGADARDARRTRQVDEAMSGGGDASHNYLNDPSGVIQNVMSIDPRFGIALDQQHATQAAARAKAAADAADTQTSLISRYVRGIDPATTDVGSALDELTPFFTNSLGMTPENIAAFRRAAVANPAILSGLDDEAFKSMAKDRFSDTIATPGSYVRRGGRTVERVPYGLRVEDTPAGTRSRVFNPNTGQYEDQSVTPQNSGYATDGTPTPPPAPELVGAGGPGSAGPAPQTRITAAEARTIRQSMPAGPAGDERFNNWIRSANITIAPDGVNVPASQSPAAPEDIVPHQVAPAPPRRASTAVGGDTATSTYNPPKPTKTTRQLTPEEVAAAGYRPGSIVEEDSTGHRSVVQAPSDRATSGARLTAQQRSNASNKLILLNQMDAQMRRVEDAMVDLDKKGWTGYIGGLVPGSLDAESDVFDKSVAGLTALVRNLTRTPGEGSMSDYESRLASAIPPSRRDTPEGRQESMATLRGLIDAARQGYTEMLAPPEDQSGDGSVAIGTIATDGQGNRRRFRGGNSSDVANWEVIR